jgi:hypothetical protein
MANLSLSISGKGIEFVRNKKAMDRKDSTQHLAVRRDMGTRPSSSSYASAMVSLKSTGSTTGNMRRQAALRYPSRAISVMALSGRSPRLLGDEDMSIQAFCVAMGRNLSKDTFSPVRDEIHCLPSSDSIGMPLWWLIFPKWHPPKWIWPKATLVVSPPSGEGTLKGRLKGSGATLVDENGE